MPADATGLRQHVTARARQAHVLASADMKTRYRTAAPYATGETQGSVDVNRFRVAGNTITSTAEATTPQAEWTDQGTRPHTIRPRNAKVLRFKIRGRVVYAREVHHPGNKGTGWFTKTGPREWHGALLRAFGRL